MPIFGIHVPGLPDIPCTNRLYARISIQGFVKYKPKSFFRRMFELLSKSFCFCCMEWCFAVPPHITRDTTQPQNFVIAMIPPRRSTTRLTTEQRTLHALPEAFKAWKDGWVDATHQDVSSTLHFEDEFQEKFISPILEEMYIGIT